MSNRYDDMSEAARALMSSMDAIDLAEECASALRGARQAEAEVMRLRAGEEPVTDPHANGTPGQWIWQWNRATPEERLGMAARIKDAMARSASCLDGGHDARLGDMRAQVARLQREVEELGDAKELYVRLATNAEAVRDGLAAALREVLAVFSTATTEDGTVAGHRAPHPIHPDDFKRWRAALDGVQSSTQSAEQDDPPVRCWHTEPGSPCDWDVCRQPERFLAGDRGADPAHDPDVDREHAELVRRAEQWAADIGSPCAHCGEPITGPYIREWNGPAGQPTRRWHADRAGCEAAAQPPACTATIATPHHGTQRCALPVGHDHGDRHVSDTLPGDLGTRWLWSDTDHGATPHKEQR